MHNNTSIYVDYDMSDKIKEAAASIIETGVKTKDAIHVASAIIADCDYFITTDIRLLKYKTDKIELLNPIEFIQKLEDEDDE